MGVDLPRWAEAAIKAVSLGYLLGLAGLGLCSFVWFRLRSRIPGASRADISFRTLATAAALQVILAVVIWYGVITHRILMTTHYFHHLMYGGWSATITTAGLGLLAISLLIAAWSALRARPLQSGDMPSDQAEARLWADEAMQQGLRLRVNGNVATASLVGVGAPALLINPAYWQSLSTEQRQLALEHEAMHCKRADNRRKLMLDAAAMAFAVLPSVRAWARSFELECELAVDAACRDRAGYVQLIANASDWLLRNGQPERRSIAAAVLPVDSGLTQAELETRLQALAHPAPRCNSGPAMWIGLLCLASSAIPALVLLSHPLTRCLLACYLGY
jgi:hypothetical protein